jgi:glycogen debranching enzyme
LIRPGGEFGAQLVEGGARFTIWSSAAEAAWVCLFDPESDEEIGRVEMARTDEHTFSTTLSGVRPGDPYGYRVDGPFAPERGHRFDPSKLLVDPYALAIDRPFAYDPRLAAPRSERVDTAPLVPKSVVTALPRPKRPAAPKFKPGGLIYELNVRGFTMRHPEVPEALRGTVAALAEPVILEHLRHLGVSAVELMPIVAWIDERHLPPLGLRNAWGYNPIAFLAPEPRICPGGIAELAQTVSSLRRAGIGVILDVVFNHTGESDAIGPTLSLRGIDNAAYFRHLPDGTLVNDTGCGNTLACDHPMTRRLILDAMRHFALHAGIDGFRFDLAPILGRTAEGFDPRAVLFEEMAADPVLSTRIMIAEPWDIGPGGYQLGKFSDVFLEWNDRYRDRVRRFWRGDGHMLGEFVTALAGSSDAFTGKTTRSVNFIAAHDGFPLADLTAYSRKHNEANGEGNRDGHEDNLSWNNGVEGPTDDQEILQARRGDIEAMLMTLFLSRGTIMLTAGDEFGRTQQGNNNAYAQDNEITWIDWEGRGRGLEAFVMDLAAFRRRTRVLSQTAFFTGERDESGLPDVVWIAPDGSDMESSHWELSDGAAFGMVLRGSRGPRLAVLFNRGRGPVEFEMPSRPGHAWESAAEGKVTLPRRWVQVVRERRLGRHGTR